MLISEENSKQSPGIAIHATKLPDGGFIILINVAKEVDDGMMTLVRYSQDKAKMWRKDVKCGEVGNIFGACDTEIILLCIGGYLVRMDSQTGEIGEKLLPPFCRTWSVAYQNGFWWITADVFFGEDGKRIRRGNLLLKCDNNFQIISKLPLSKYTQGLHFSPDGKYIYVFIYKDQIMVVNTETITVENVLKDKFCLIFNRFDGKGRLWLQRESAIAEAWDVLLTRTLSLHKLKGAITKWWKDENGVMHAVTCKDVSMSNPYPWLNRV